MDAKESPVFLCYFSATLDEKPEKIDVHQRGPSRGGEKKSTVSADWNFGVVDSDTSGTAEDDSNGGSTSPAIGASTGLGTSGFGKRKAPFLMGHARGRAEQNAQSASQQSIYETGGMDADGSARDKRSMERAVHAVLTGAYKGRICELIAYNSPRTVHSTVPKDLSLCNANISQDMWFYAMPGGMHLYEAGNPPDCNMFMVRFKAGMATCYMTCLVYYEMARPDFVRKALLSEGAPHGISEYPELVAPRILALVSRDPLYSFGADFLKGLFEQFIANGFDEQMYYYSISQLLEMKMPRPTAPMPTLQLGSTEITLHGLPTSFGSAPPDASFIEFFSRADSINHIIQIFCALLHEEKVIFFSNDVRKLSHTVEFVAGLMFPFQFKGMIYANPIMPFFLVQSVHGATGPLYGIPSFIWGQNDTFPQNSLGYDLDSGTFTNGPTPGNPYSVMPVFEILRADLDLIIRNKLGIDPFKGLAPGQEITADPNEIQMMLRVAFFRFFCKALVFARLSFISDRYCPEQMVIPYCSSCDLFGLPNFGKFVGSFTQQIYGASLQEAYGETWPFAGMLDQGAFHRIWDIPLEDACTVVANIDNFLMFSPPESIDPNRKDILKVPLSVILKYEAGETLKENERIMAHDFFDRIISDQLISYPKCVVVDVPFLNMGSSRLYQVFDYHLLYPMLTAEQAWTFVFVSFLSEEEKEEIDILMDQILSFTVNNDGSSRARSYFEITPKRVYFLNRVIEKVRDGEVRAKRVRHRWECENKEVWNLLGSLMSNLFEFSYMQKDYYCLYQVMRLVHRTFYIDTDGESRYLYTAYPPLKKLQDMDVWKMCIPLLESDTIRLHYMTKDIYPAERYTTKEEKETHANAEWMLTRTRFVEYVEMLLDFLFPPEKFVTLLSKTVRNFPEKDFNTLIEHVKKKNQATGNAMMSIMESNRARVPTERYVCLWVDDKVNTVEKMNTQRWMEKSFHDRTNDGIHFEKIESTEGLETYLENIMPLIERKKTKVRVVTNRYRKLDGEDAAAERVIRLVREKFKDRDLPILIFCGKASLVPAKLLDISNVFLTDHPEKVVPFLANGKL